MPSVCIDEQLWRIGLGTRVMTFVAADAKLRGAEAVTLKCAHDAAADAFWPTLGFQHIADVAGRRRILKAWCLPITAAADELPMPPRSCWGLDRRICDLPTPIPPPTLNAD